MNYSQAYFRKADLDTCLTALILGVTADWQIHAGCGDAAAALRADPAVCCIEAGGSGQVCSGNFDHHDPHHYWPPACQQALAYSGSADPAITRLVEYVSAIDEARPLTHIQFPSLSTIFSGMLLCESDPERQFFMGIKILATLLECAIIPYDTMPDLPEWRAYRHAKVCNRIRLSDILTTAEYRRSERGTVVGIVRFPRDGGVRGGLKTLYDSGAQAVLLYDPTFGSPPVHKFTIAGNGVHVAAILPDLNRLEDGWGGRETIIGSPHSGSMLPCDAVVDLLIRRL